MPQLDKHANERFERPLRVLFVMGALDAGGAEKMVIELLRALDRSRIQTSLFLIWHRGVFLNDVPSDVKVSWGLEDGQLVRNHAPSFLRRLLSAVRDCDVVVGGVELLPSFFGWLGAAIAKKPLIGWVHTELRSYLEHEHTVIRILARLLYPRFDKIVAVSPPVAHSLQDIAGMNAERIEVIPNFIDGTRIHDLAAERLPGWAEPFASKPYFVGLGRLVNREKGFDLLIRAQARLRESGVDSDLVILGEGPDRCELEGLARDLGVEKSVHLPGYSPNPFPVLAKARALVAPSRIDGLNLSIVEAMSLSVPVIASRDSKGVAWVLGDGQHGIVLQANDPSSIAKEMHSILLSPERRTECSLRGKLRSNDFSSSSKVERWMNLILAAEEDRLKAHVK